MVIKYHISYRNLNMEREIDKNEVSNLQKFSTLFENKKKNLSTKKLTHIVSDTGKTRHYTPAAQEWHNSVYSYNANYTKTLPVADTSMMKLLKSFFNLELNKKILKTKRMATRYKRLTTKRIYIGRGDIKHTSSKAIITFYMYNTEIMSSY